MTIEDEWNAFCISCDKERMTNITKLPPDNYLYQCRKCKNIYDVEFHDAARIIAKMKELGVEIRRIR